VSGQTVDATEGVAGLYGKVATYGDFVTRRLPRSFVAPWEAWLSECLQSSRERLGAEWLEVYLTSPIWRFFARQGAIDAHAWAGVVMPSVDRVGRHYPLTIAAALPDAAMTLALLSQPSPWFERAEQLALSSLEDDFDFASFDQAVCMLGEPATREPKSRCLAGDQHGETQWYFALHSAADLHDGFSEAMERLSADALRRRTVWWTSGSDRVPPSIVVCPGLPAASGFAAFLDGRWFQWGWNREVGAAGAPGEHAVPQ
jgi:type VI secretion system protein ImpM